MNKVAIVVGRFQVPELTEGHKSLFRQISTMFNPDSILVGVGISAAKLTKTNPLDFNTRKIKLNYWLETQFDHITITPIPDQESNQEWYKSLDNLITMTYPNSEVKLFGGRDSFLDLYKSFGGKFDYEIVETTNEISATEVRQNIANNPGYSKEFSSGIIYATMNQYPKVYPTVDIAIYNDHGEVLLGRKPAESKFRFIGGFVDPKDICLEETGLREAYEEAGFLPNNYADRHNQMEYVCSMKMDDWRYRNTPDTIHTTLFAIRDSGGSLNPGDDIAELKWFKISDLKNVPIMEVHKVLVANFITWAERKKLYVRT
jgi:bifunctional NMN adenylyltransferase/nudix hydrolase